MGVLEQVGGLVIDLERVEIKQLRVPHNSNYNRLQVQFTDCIHPWGSRTLQVIRGVGSEQHRRRERREE